MPEPESPLHELLRRLAEEGPEGRRAAAAFACGCAEGVLPLFLRRHPGMSSPSRILSAAKAGLDDPSFSAGGRAEPRAKDAFDAAGNASDPLGAAAECAAEAVTFAAWAVHWLHHHGHPESSVPMLARSAAERALEAVRWAEEGTSAHERLDLFCASGSVLTSDAFLSHLDRLRADLRAAAGNDA